MAFGIRTTSVARCVPGSGYLMPMARLTPVSVVFSAVSLAYFLRLGLVEPARPDLQLAEDVGPILAVDRQWDAGAPELESYFGNPWLQRDGGGRLDLGRGAIAADLAPEAIDDSGDREALLTRSRRGGGRVVDDRANRHERADQQ